MLQLLYCHLQGGCEIKLHNATERCGSTTTGAVHYKAKHIPMQSHFKDDCIEK